MFTVYLQSYLCVLHPDSDTTGWLYTVDMCNLDFTVISDILQYVYSMFTVLPLCIISWQWHHWMALHSWYVYLWLYSHIWYFTVCLQYVYSLTSVYNILTVTPLDGFTQLICITLDFLCRDSIGHFFQQL